MPSSAELPIYRLSVIAFVFLVSSIVAPRFLRGSEGGLAAAASAVLTFLVCLAVASLVSMVLFAKTLRMRRSISLGAQMAGYTPLGLTVALVAIVWFFLRY